MFEDRKEVLQRCYMPIYTYRCEECGVQFERSQKFSDAPLTRCPECNKKALRKVYTPVGIVFKGSGFYATDNRSPSGGRSHGEHGEKSDKKEPEKDSSKDDTSKKESSDQASTSNKTSESETK
ncbi:MAG: zinc ribbon domain-containing protein [Anaerolineaceae bacterium]|nr:zinc ribbon domain-containing protein [Anaerolineaceae bacterium]